MSTDSSSQKQPIDTQSPLSHVRSPRRYIVVAGVVWLVYLIALTATSLYYFPWRKPAEGSADRFISSMVAGMPEEKKKEVLELQRKLQEATKPTFFGEFKRYRRMPCWTEAARDELISTMGGEPSGGDRVRLTISMDFAEPVRAWDRFAIEMSYGIGLAAVIQIVWVSVLYIRKRSRRGRELLDLGGDRK